MIRFNQNAWLKTYIHMNTDVGKKEKNDFKKEFFKLMNNAVFGGTMGNVRKHRGIKLSTTERRRNYSVSEPNYHTTKFFTENVLEIETKKAQILMNKPVNLEFSILELSKMLMYEFWYDYVKPKYSEKINCLIWIWTVSLYILKKIDTCKEISEDVETRYDTSSYKLVRPLPKGKNKKVIELMKDELGEKVMTKFVGLRDKTYSYLIDDGSEDKITKGTEKFLIKRGSSYCYKKTHKEFIKNNKLK